MKKLLFVALVLTLQTGCSQINFGSTINDAKDKLNIKGDKKKKLSNEEIIQGLKEALNVGAKNAASMASKADGFYKNPQLKIPFPEDAKDVEQKLRKFGLGRKVDEFVLTMNRAAEESSKEAAQVFLAAVKNMSVTDGLSILQGEENAATNYLKNATSDELRAKFTPIVKAAMDKVEIAKYWNPLIKRYNMLPGVQKKDPDLEAYITDKAIDGLFVLIAQEEAKIRKDPVARVSDILKKVFGNA